MDFSGSVVMGVVRSGDVARVRHMLQDRGLGSDADPFQALLDDEGVVSLAIELSRQGSSQSYLRIISILLRDGRVLNKGPKQLFTKWLLHAIALQDLAAVQTLLDSAPLYVLVDAQALVHAAAVAAVRSRHAGDSLGVLTHLVRTLHVRVGVPAVHDAMLSAMQHLATLPGEADVVASLLDVEPGAALPVWSGQRRMMDALVVHGDRDMMRVLMQKHVVHARDLVVAAAWSQNQDVSLLHFLLDQDGITDDTRSSVLDAVIRQGRQSRTDIVRALCSRPDAVQPTTKTVLLACRTGSLDTFRAVVESLATPLPSFTKEEQARFLSAVPDDATDVLHELLVVHGMQPSPRLFVDAVVAGRLQKTQMFLQQDPALHRVIPEALVAACSSSSTSYAHSPDIFVYLLSPGMGMGMESVIFAIFVRECLPMLVQTRKTDVLQATLPLISGAWQRHPEVSADWFSRILRVALDSDTEPPMAVLHTVLHTVPRTSGCPVAASLLKDAIKLGNNTAVDMLVKDGRVLQDIVSGTQLTTLAVLAFSHFCVPALGALVHRAAEVQTSAEFERLMTSFVTRAWETDDPVVFAVLVEHLGPPRPPLPPISRTQLSWALAEAAYTERRVRILLFVLEALKSGGGVGDGGGEDAEHKARLQGWLQACVQVDDVDMVMVLLRAKGGVVTALQDAVVLAVEAFPPARRVVLKLMSELGADAAFDSNRVWRTARERGLADLAHAIMKDNVIVAVARISDMGSDPNVVLAEFADTATMYLTLPQVKVLGLTMGLQGAVMARRMDVVRFCLENGAELEPASPLLRLPLTKWMVVTNQVDMVEMVLTHFSPGRSFFTHMFENDCEAARALVAGPQGDAAGPMLFCLFQYTLRKQGIPESVRACFTVLDLLLPRFRAAISPKNGGDVMCAQLVTPGHSPTRVSIVSKLLRVDGKLFSPFADDCLPLRTLGMSMPTASSLKILGLIFRYYVSVHNGLSDTIFPDVHHAHPDVIALWHTVKREADVLAARWSVMRTSWIGAVVAASSAAAAAADSSRDEEPLSKRHR